MFLSLVLYEYLFTCIVLEVVGTSMHYYIILALGSYIIMFI